MEMQNHFPALPAELQQRFQTPSLALRVFGSRIEDIQVDLRQAARPQLITRILQICSVPYVDEELFWALTVSQRTQALLHLAYLSRPGPWMMPLRCGHAACSQTMEVEVALDDFSFSENGREPLCIGVRGRLWRFRKPLGADQRHWQREVYPVGRAAVLNILRTLHVDSDQQPDRALEELSTDELGQIEKAMEAFDPGMRIQFESSCPHCGQTSQHELDAEDMAFETLQKIQQEVLYEIHQLAKAYHWSEADICAMPAWRRRQYLAWIEKEQ